MEILEDLIYAAEKEMDDDWGGWRQLIIMQYGELAQRIENVFGFVEQDTYEIPGFCQASLQIDRE